MNIIIIDSQGGGIGRQVITRLQQNLSNLKQNLSDIRIIALGTNVIATNNMLKAGADDSATGENAIVFNCRKATADDVIIGPLGIVMANSMLGELSPSMAQAAAESAATKYLIPFQKCNAYVAGVTEKPLSAYIDEIAEHISEQVLS